jgi:hypothetical protein
MQLLLPHLLLHICFDRRRGGRRRKGEDRYGGMVHHVHHSESHGKCEKAIAEGERASIKHAFVTTNTTISTNCKANGPYFRQQALNPSPFFKNMPLMPEGYLPDTHQVLWGKTMVGIWENVMIFKQPNACHLQHFLRKHLMANDFLFKNFLMLHH